jgi:hypothetical protein
MGAVSVELRILGCSHQALVRAEGDLLSEVVACLPDGSRNLPRSLSRPGAHRDYAFSSEVLSLSGLEHGRRARAVVEEVESDPDGLLGVFPGLPNAFTAVRWRGDGSVLRWETWHSYPQTREIVHTASTLEPAGGSRPSAGPPA